MQGGCHVFACTPCGLRRRLLLASVSRARKRPAGQRGMVAEEAGRKRRARPAQRRRAPSCRLDSPEGVGARVGGRGRRSDRVDRAVALTRASTIGPRPRDAIATQAVQRESRRRTALARSGADPRPRVLAPAAAGLYSGGNRRLPFATGSVGRTERCGNLTDGKRALPAARAKLSHAPYPVRAVVGHRRWATKGQQAWQKPNDPQRTHRSQTSIPERSNALGRPPACVLITRRSGSNPALAISRKPCKSLGSLASRVYARRLDFAKWVTKTATTRAQPPLEMSPRST
jgi:hypothetical protein